MRDPDPIQYRSPLSMPNVPSTMDCRCKVVAGTFYQSVLVRDKLLLGLRERRITKP